MAAAGASKSSKAAKFEDAIVENPIIDYATTKSDDVELWAIRVPPGFDPAKLDSLTLRADGASGDGFTVRSAPAAEAGSIVPAFPSAKKNRWMLGKPFTRQLVVVVPPPSAHAHAAVVPPPLPPVPQVGGMRLSRPYPELKAPLPAAPGRDARASARSAEAPAAASKKRAEAPSSSSKSERKKPKTRR